VQFGVNSTQQVLGTALGSRLPFNYRFDLRLDKDFYFKLGGRRASEEGGQISQNSRERNMMFNVYVVVLNLLNSQNILGVYQYSGQPDNSGLLESPIGEQIINSNGIDRQAFVDQFRVRERTPDNFGLPRRLRLGVSLFF
jgi:hypothetical protein